MNFAPSMPLVLPPAELTYNISSSLLSGKIDGVFIAAHALSGGRGGSKTPGTLNWWLANNPFATHVKLSPDGSVPGGPLPMGRYRLSLHESRSNWLRLMPLLDTAMHGRSGMAIHGRGKRGSDGCIVPTDFAVVTRLCELVRQRRDNAKSEIHLEVVAIGQDLDRQFRTA